LNNQFTIQARGISKKFNDITLFKDLDFSISIGKSLAVTGPNGSGKSTLLEIAALLRMPTKGTVRYSQNESDVPSDKIHSLIGFSSFRINPYGELTGYENIMFVAGGTGKDMSRADELLDRLNLYQDRNKRVRHYSSGMKQRLRFLLAVINEPPVLFFDEPGANLDRLGKDIIYSYIISLKKERIIIIATNEEEEAGLCDERIRLGV
jgi:heme exporter protein A